MLNIEQIDRLVNQGANVLTGDGEKIGSIAQVFVDNAGGQPSWVTVRTGLFGMSESFVPLEGARAEGGDIIVPYSKSQVKDAPRIDADGALEPDEEDRLYKHYRLETGGTYTEAAADTAVEPAETGTERTGTLPTPGHDATTPPTDANTQPDTTASDRTTAREPYENAGAPGFDTTAPPTDAAPASTAQETTPTERGTGSAADGTPAYGTAGEGRGLEQQTPGRGRLRKYVTTEYVTRTVPVQREEVRIEREPITEQDRGTLADRADDENEVILHEERVIVTKETVPVERVHLGTKTVTEDVTIKEKVRKEHIDTEGSDENTG